MKAKLVFKEYTKGVMSDSYKRIANIDNDIIKFKTDYNDTISINVKQDSIYVKRIGVINYDMVHQKNEKYFIDISIDGMGIKEKLEVEIFTKDLIIDKKDKSLFLELNYKKNKDDIINKYEITWR